MARKAGKIYGTEIEQNSRNSPQSNRANGGNQIWNEESKDKNLHNNVKDISRKEQVMKCFLKLVNSVFYK
jgi:hypothetical protein